jgi:hypothetical protein
MLNVVMLNIVMLNVVMLNVVMLNVIMLNVVASFEKAAKFYERKKFYSDSSPVFENNLEDVFPSKRDDSKTIFFLLSRFSSKKLSHSLKRYLDTMISHMIF